jgi:hypothetical protein
VFKNRGNFAIVLCPIDTIRSKYPDCGIGVLGDFNHLNMQDLVLYNNYSERRNLIRQ